MLSFQIVCFLHISIVCMNITYWNFYWIFQIYFELQLSKMCKVSVGNQLIFKVVKRKQIIRSLKFLLLLWYTNAALYSDGAQKSSNFWKNFDIFFEIRNFINSIHFNNCGSYIGNALYIILILTLIFIVLSYAAVA